MKFTAAKAIAAAVGSTLTALTTAWATARVVLEDSALDPAEYGLIVTAVATLIGTVYAVWRTPNKPIS